MTTTMERFCSTSAAASLGAQFAPLPLILPRSPQTALPSSPSTPPFSPSSRTARFYFLQQLQGWRDTLRTFYFYGGCTRVRAE